MAVPKKRTGHSDQGHRRSNWKAIVPSLSTCKNCGAPRFQHTMCGACGFYKDRIILKSLTNDGDDVEVPAALDPVEPEMPAAEDTPKASKKDAEQVKETVDDAPDTEASAPPEEDTAE